jgi:hypothetical protein
MRRRVSTLIAVAILLVAGASSAQKKKPPKPTPPRGAEDDATRKEAHAHFDRGRAWFEKRVYDAAFAEFLRSRQIFPTRGNTQNAAVCLRELGRYDEALDMLEALLREFPGSPADVRLVATEIERLRPRVGSIDVRVVEPGATVLVDGRVRGETPMSAPLRVKAGAHVVRLYKDGFVPFEKQFDVAGESSARVVGELTPLTRFGRLRVVERSGRALPVIVDGITVGASPWEGNLDAGHHVVLLRGGDDEERAEGTQPVAIVIKREEPSTLTLDAVSLDAAMRIEPLPGGATVALDGVTLGDGAWEGSLPSGSHRVEVALVGYVPYKRDIALESSARRQLLVQLERDESSPIWQDPTPPRFFAELDAALVVTPEIGGHVSNACRSASSCSRSVPFGQLALLRAGYQLRSGLLFGLDLGFLRWALSTTGRPGDQQPPPADGQPNPISIDDSDVLTEWAIGGFVGQHSRGKRPWTLRVGAGLLIGSASDKAVVHSTGVAQTGSFSIEARAKHFFVGPDARYGIALGKQLELSVGAHILVLQILNQPSVDSTYTADGPTSPPPTLQGQTLGGKTTLFAGLGIGVLASP